MCKYLSYFELNEIIQVFIILCAPRVFVLCVIKWLRQLVLNRDPFASHNISVLMRGKKM